MAKIGVIGAGSWGTALAVVLEKNGHQVTVWSAVASEIEMLKKHREHVDKLPGVMLADTIQFTTDKKEAVSGMEALVFAVPSMYVRNTAREIAPYAVKDQLIISVAKGIEEDTLMTLSQIIRQEIPQPTALVAGARSRKTAEQVQHYFMNEAFRVYTSPDVTGMEIGASLKNVIALAAGMADGLGYGDNTKAALITRGINEIDRLALAMGAKYETLNGLTGIGDLIVTCASRHSRNRRAGMLIGQGKTMKEAMDEVKMVVEGVYCAKAAMGLSRKYGVSLPIIEQVNAVLFEDKPAKEAVFELMTRDKKAENDELDWESDS